MDFLSGAGTASCCCFLYDANFLQISTDSACRPAISVGASTAFRGLALDSGLIRNNKMKMGEEFKKKARDVIF